MKILEERFKDILDSNSADPVKALSQTSRDYFLSRIKKIEGEFLRQMLSSAKRVDPIEFIIHKLNELIKEL